MIGGISVVRPSRQPLRGFLRMRIFLNIINGIRHPEGAPGGRVSKDAQCLCSPYFCVFSIPSRARDGQGGMSASIIVVDDALREHIVKPYVASCRGAPLMPEIVADPPSPSCSHLFLGPRIQESQRLSPDPFWPRSNVSSRFSSTASLPTVRQAGP